MNISTINIVASKPMNFFIGKLTISDNSGNKIILKFDLFAMMSCL